MSEAQPNSRTIRVTERLIDEVADLLIEYPSLEKTLKDFFEFRRTAKARQSFGKKDYQLRGKDLGGTWHVHLIHGQALLIYSIKTKRVDCYCIVDHSFVESHSKQRSLAEYIKSLGDEAFVSIHENQNTLFEAVEEGAALTQDQIALIDASFYEFVADPKDRAIVKKACAGDFRELRSYLGCLIERNLELDDEWAFVVAAFHGEVALQTKLTTILSYLAYSVS